jgi:hypothetical protein
MVTLKGAGFSGVVQLGLAARMVKVVPRWKHADFRSDDFGPDIPPEVQFMLAEVFIELDLVHFDETILSQASVASMAGVSKANGGFGTEGILVGCGTTMGRNGSVGDGQCNYMTLGLASPVLSRPWRFFNSYLADNPITWPLGVEAEVVPCRWRVVPYTPQSANADMKSAGVILWDRSNNT